MKLKRLCTDQFLQGGLFVSSVGIQAFAGVEDIPHRRYVRMGDKWEVLPTTTVRHALFVNEVTALRQR